MEDKKKVLEIIAGKLEGMLWAIFAGTAVEIYTHGKRIGNDIDIIVPDDSIDEVGKRFNVAPVLETREKGNVKIINDYHIETVVEGVSVEFVGKTEKFIIDGYEYDSTKNLRETLFPKVEKKTYLGVEVFVVSVEELLVQKMLFNRSGKWQDENDVNLLLKIKEVNEEALIKALDRWRVPDEKRENFIDRIKNQKLI